MNTPEKGKFRHIVFKDGNTWYAVALEFNLVETGEDARLAFMSLLQAVSGYVQSMKRIKGIMKFDSLNQKTDPEYEKLWSALTSRNSKGRIKSPFQVGMYGVASV